MLGLSGVFSRMEVESESVVWWCNAQSSLKVAQYRNESGSSEIFLHSRQNRLRVQHCTRCLSVGYWEHFLLLLSQHQGSLHNSLPTVLQYHSPLPSLNSFVVLLLLPSSASSPLEPTPGSLSSEALVAFLDSSFGSLHPHQNQFPNSNAMSLVILMNMIFAPLQIS